MGCVWRISKERYSDDFTENMQHMLELLEKGAEVEMTVSGDEICKACPNLKSGVCLSADLVEHYDRKVLEHCGLKEKESLSFREFVDNVQKKYHRDRKTRGNLWWLPVE